jgi:cyclophilin family peptidyl-prolyl cis-trans isomerase
MDRRLFCFLLFAFGFPQTPCAAEPRVVREEIEWLDVWVPGNGNASLPKVLLIGDSIARGYYAGVEDRLKGKAIVARLTTSKSLGDPGLIAEVKLVLSMAKFDVVHVNNGLHGWGYTEVEYAAAFPELLKAIRDGAPQAKRVWATTTPMRVPDRLGEIADKTARVKARNAIAAKIVAAESIPTNDLYALLEDKADWFSRDGVHLNAKGTSALAAATATAILALLPQQPPVVIVVSTSKGELEIELDAVRAPKTVANFLRYVDAKRYDGGIFHRTVTPDNQPDNAVKIEVIQGGVQPDREKDAFPAIALERTRDTKIPHKDGTVSMARDGPDTATSDIFICIGDQPELDFGGKRNPDGQGFAAFGRVVKGMDVVRAIQKAKADGQKLDPPVIIRSATRK